MATVPVALRQDVVRKAIMAGSPWCRHCRHKAKYREEEVRISIALAKTCPHNDRTPFHKVFLLKAPELTVRNQCKPSAGRQWTHTVTSGSHCFQWKQAWCKFDSVCSGCPHLLMAQYPKSDIFPREKEQLLLDWLKKKSHLGEAGFKIRYWSFLHQEGFILSLLVFGQWLLKTYKRIIWLYSHIFF